MLDEKRINEFYDKMKEVAALMEGYTLKEDTYTCRGAVGRELVMDDINIIIRLDEYQNERLYIFGRYEDWEEPGYGVKPKAVEIYVAEKSKPEWIVSNIQRRLLPAYLKNLEEIRERNNRLSQFKMAKERAFDKLSKICHGWRVVAHNGSIMSAFAYFKGGKLTYEGEDSMSVTLGELTYDQVEAIMKALYGVAKDE